jgi:glycerol-3-phosphate acyltransferase PlsY
MIVDSILLILGGYLLGSISPTYLIGRWFGKKDLRRYGSGTLGGSMVYEHVGRSAVVPVALFDIVKAALPALVGLRLGLGEAVAAAAGLGITGRFFCSSPAGGGCSLSSACGWPSFPLGLSGWEGS